MRAAIACAQLAIIFLYTVEAHPAGSASPYREKEWLTSFNIREDIRLAQPESAAERHVLAGACRDALGLNIPMLPGTIDNRTWEAYECVPNAAYLIGRDGRVALRQGWFHSGSFGRAINTLLREQKSGRDPCTLIATTAALDKTGKK